MAGTTLIAREASPGGDTSAKVAQAQNNGPVPLFEPCLFPDVSELSALRQRAELVARGRRTSAHVYTLVPGEDSQVTRFIFHVDEVIGKGDSSLAGTEIWIKASGAVEGFLKQDVDYIVFLGGRQEAAGPYGVLNGVLGRFVIDNGNVFRYCIDYTGPREVLATGAGQGESVAEFLALIRSLA